MKIGVIVTTYNQPTMLKAVLQGYNRQTDDDFEIVIADDGSTHQTRAVIEDFKDNTKFKVSHCWHEDNGFRAAEIRNKAVTQCDSEYLVFSDGDCVPSDNFVASHRTYSEAGFFLAGNRILCNRVFTANVVSELENCWGFSLWQWLLKFYKGEINSFLPLLTFPNSSLRKLTPNRWSGVKTCNLSLWRRDFENVNGLDESFQGWGLEDSDLAIRLVNSKVFHKSVRYAALVFHLWHPLNNKDNLHNNLVHLSETINSNRIHATKGLNQHFLRGRNG